MEENTGHFIQGAWVAKEASTEGQPAPAPAQPRQDPPIDERISDLSGRVSRDITDLFHLTCELLTTEAGHRHIGQLVARAQEELEKTVNDLFKDENTNGKEKSTAPVDEHAPPGNH